MCFTQLFVFTMKSGLVKADSVKKNRFWSNEEKEE